MNTTFHEDQLPEGQSPILTSNIERLKAFTHLLTDPESPYSTMGIVTAPSGSAKRSPLRSLRMLSNAVFTRLFQ